MQHYHKTETDILSPATTGTEPMVFTDKAADAIVTDDVSDPFT